MKITLRKVFIFCSILLLILFCWTILASKNLSPSSNAENNLSNYKNTTNNLKDVKIVNNVEAPIRDDLESLYPFQESHDDVHELNQGSNIKNNKKNRQKLNQDYRNIPCKINDEYRIDCLKNQHNSSFYIPLNFIKKYFEINTKFVTNSRGQEFLDWRHSYSKIFYPDQPYSSNDKYLWFENYNVELRERVLCVSGTDGVPISTQWYSKGHFYSTQIAQYGLSHFNKNRIVPSPKRILLCQYSRFTKKANFSFLNENESDFHSSPRTISLTNPAFGYLIADIILEPFGHFNLTFHLKDNTDDSQHSLIYSTLIDTFFIKSSDSFFTSVIPTFGINLRTIQNTKFNMTRDLLVDLVKGGLTSIKKRSNFTVTKIDIFGNITLHTMALMTSAHESFSITAGKWFLSNQNELGGWEIKVRRKLQKNQSGTLILEPGWHSAMAQGQAISLLIRLYQSTKDEKYLNSAKKALKIFDMESIQRGVRAKLFNQYVWFEEYPTVPSIFVLNGFIYSLFGLYDLSKACQDSYCQKAETLFNEGIRSLEEVLPLYDTGSGSFYDLRHLALGGPPNIARWDYHSTHINQLLQLNTIVKRDIFTTTAERWTKYMSGHRAPHN